MIPGTELISGELLTGASLAIGGLVIAAYMVGIQIPYTGYILVVMSLLVIIGVFRMIRSTHSEEGQ